MKGTIKTHLTDAEDLKEATWLEQDPKIICENRW